MEVNDSSEAFDASDPGATLRLAEAQYAAASAIYGSSDAAEILSAVVVFGGKAYQDAHLALLETDLEPPKVRVVAQRAGSAITASAELRPFKNYPANDSLGAVEYLYAADISEDPFLTDEERQMLTAQGVVGLAIVPLVVGQNMTGLLMLSSPERVETPIPVLRALRNLADQIAVVFENRSLLRRTESSLGEIQTLYELNRGLLAAQDPLELLRAISAHLAPDADTIMHAVVNRRREGGEEVSVQHIITRKGEQVVNIPIKGMRVASMLSGEPAEVTFVEDVLEASTDAPLLELLRERTRSYAAIVARASDRHADIVTVAYEQPHLFDSRDRRLYGASADQLNIVLQNQRLLQESQASAERLERQVRVLQLLNHLATRISSFQTEKQLLDNVVREMQEGLRVDHIGVALFPPGQSVGVVTSEYPDMNATGQTINMDDNPMMAMVAKDPTKPLIVQNIESDPIVPAPVRTMLRSVGVRALMILPLYVQGALIGTIGFDINEEGRHFSPETVELAQTMTSQVVVGLQNIRLFNEAHRRAEQLQAVAVLGQTLQASLEIEPVLRVMLTSGVGIVPTEQMSVALYDEQEGVLRVVGRYADGESDIDLLNSPMLSLKDTYAGQVWTSGAMIVLGGDRVGGDRTAPVEGYSGTSGVMIAPIRAREHRLGTVTISAPPGSFYTETDKAIFLQIASLLAVALENSEAYARSQRIAHGEALVNEMTARFQQFSDIEGLVTTAVNELGKALGARQARVRLSDPDMLAH
ncbi:MAG: GAF domain-containing protein [Chloroflexi bacterium]|nr:GAF domain-containing protein [Chloroflexota bacterium]